MSTTQREWGTQRNALPAAPFEPENAVLAAPTKRGVSLVQIQPRAALRVLLALRVVSAFVDSLIERLAAVVAVEEALAKNLDPENTKRYQAKIVQGLIADGKVPAIEYTKGTRAKKPATPTPSQLETPQAPAETPQQS